MIVMKARDYRLVVDGKYNRRAIMQRAWAYMKKNKAFKWYSFAKALKDAWVGKSSVSCPLKPSDSTPLKHSTMPP